MNEKEKLREQIRKELNTILDEEYDAMLLEIKKSQTIANGDIKDVDINDGQQVMKD